MISFNNIISGFFHRVSVKEHNISRGYKPQRGVLSKTWFQVVGYKYWLFTQFHFFFLHFKLCLVLKEGQFLWKLLSVQINFSNIHSRNVPQNCLYYNNFVDSDGWIHQRLCDKSGTVIRTDRYLKLISCATNFKKRAKELFSGYITKSFHIIQASNFELLVWCVYDYSFALLKVFYFLFYIYWKTIFKTIIVLD